jgi:hypothetical protein
MAGIEGVRAAGSLPLATCAGLTSHMSINPARVANAPIRGRLDDAVFEPYSNPLSRICWRAFSDFSSPSIPSARLTPGVRSNWMSE